MARGVESGESGGNKKNRKNHKILLSFFRVGMLVFGVKTGFDGAGCGVWVK